MKKLLLLVFLIQPIFLFGQVPELNKVKFGKIGISIYYGDTLLSVGSNQLIVLVNELTREITVRLDPSSLRTGIDSLDAKLRSSISNEVIFTGVIGLDKIWQKGERAKSFEVEGDLTINNITRNVSMFGSLRDSEQGMGINGLLYLHFDPELNDFGLKESMPMFADFGCVEILQPIAIGNDRH